jgi:F420H(2)-dependent quinone reductase
MMGNPMNVDYMRLVDRNWPLLQRLIRAHAIVYRASAGMVGHRLPGWPQVLLLDHVGAKSNVKRTTPLLYAVDGEDIVIVASKGGGGSTPIFVESWVCGRAVAVVDW